MGGEGGRQVRVRGGGEGVRGGKYGGGGVESRMIMMVDTISPPPHLPPFLPILA